MGRSLYLSLLVCAALVFSGFGASFAAAKAPAQDRLVLCTGFGTAIIFVDANGQTTVPPELCADALKSIIALTSETTRIETLYAASHAVDWPGFTAGQTHSDVISATARAPPN